MRNRISRACLLPSDKKPRRVKKPHHLDEFESGFDDEMELSGLPRRSAIDRKRRLPPALEPRYAPAPHLSVRVCLLITPKLHTGQLEADSTGGLCGSYCS